MKEKQPTDLQKFIMWFVTPAAVLETIPKGAGAFVALSMAFTLCERFYRIDTNT